MQWALTYSTCYFNPRTPVGCDECGREIQAAKNISIHAPQWGATTASPPTRPTRPYFNPRTPVGCDFVALPGVALIGIFQSTHPSGVRRQGFPRSLRFSSISIHAPQWGATLSGWTDHVTVDYFNPRTPVGCDLVWDPREVIDYRFQSTHPSGVRPSIARRCNAYVDFNPRTPVGCDPTRYDKCPATGYFNPRTPVGCDRHRHAVRRIRQISIHAPQWGATRRWSKTVQPSRFQSTHPSGVRRWHPNTHASLSISIHAPQWGATL
mgnify:CR=1 FL=1